MQIGGVPRIRLANLPTPLEEMPRLTEALGGPRLFVKRDDLTGLGWGGNKIRKLEFVMADAKRKGADTVITFGGVQSNCAREISAAARRLGMKPVLFLLGKEPEEYTGNLLLDKIFGAEIHFFEIPPGVQTGGIDLEMAMKMMEQIAAGRVSELESEGRRCYIIPAGACTPIGCVGYVNAVLELVQQANERGIKIDYIVHATGSGGTQAGMVLGVKALNAGIRVVGVDIGGEFKNMESFIAKMANETAKVLGLGVSVKKEEVTILRGYVGEGYAIPTEECIEAIKLVAEKEGLTLDPVYTGKAMAALIDQVREGAFSKEENVVFLHTGGEPAVFAYPKFF